LGFLASPVFGQQIKINSGAYLKNTGTAYIKIDNGNLINNGVYIKGDEILTFLGNTAKTISGSSNTELNNLLVINTGGITTQLGLLTTNALTIETGSMFTIAAAKAVTVNGTLANSAGNSGLVIKSDTTGSASFIHHTNSIAATVQRYISGVAEAWHFLSSPVSNQIIGGSWLPSGTYGNGTGYDLYLWNEPNSCWIYKLDITSAINWNTVHPGSDFVLGRGYLYSVQATNPVKEFAGNLNNGTINLGLTFASDTVNLKGFNLIGNPYPSSIDWEAASGWTRSNLVSSGGGYDMWIWNPSANNYGVYNSFTGMGTNSVTRYIAPMQGYFVRANGTGNLSLDNTVRVHDGAGDWKNATINSGMLSLVVQSEADKSFDESRLLFGYDVNQSSTAKLFSPVVTAPSLYLPSGGEYYSVRYLTDTVDNSMVPVMFKAGRDANYILKCDFDPYEFEVVMLEDRQTHYIQNLKTLNSYIFQSSTSDDEFRFILHFGANNEFASSELPARIYTNGIQLIIDLTLISKETNVWVFDILGRSILQQELQGQNQHNLILDIDTQMLIVYLKNPNGTMVRKLSWCKK